MNTAQVIRCLIHFNKRRNVIIQRSYSHVEESQVAPQNTTINLITSISHTTLVKIISQNGLYYKFVVIDKKSIVISSTSVTVSNRKCF